MGWAGVVSVKVEFPAFIRVMREVLVSNSPFVGKVSAVRSSKSPVLDSSER